VRPRSMFDNSFPSRPTPANTFRHIFGRRMRGLRRDA
jgi:hypothetical protein